MVDIVLATARQGTREAHALRSRRVLVRIPEGHMSHYLLVVGCKCGWLDRMLRSGGDARVAYREHKEEARHGAATG